MFINIKSKRINYQLTGQGQPIILVHGWGGSIDSLKDLGLLLAKNHQVVLVDLPGFGQSDPSDPNWGVGEYSIFLINFLSSINLSSVIYFGHSFGGSLGIYLASHRPSIIKKLILCDTAYKRTGKVSKTTQRLKILIDKIPLPENLIIFLKKVYYRLFFPGSDLLKLPHLEQNFRKIIYEDLTCYLRKITCPTLILWGEEDRETSKTFTDELKTKIKKSTLKIFPAVGHNLPIVEPEKVYHEILKFL